MNGPDDFIAAHGGEAFLKLMDAAEESRQVITLRPGESPEAVDSAEEVLLNHAERLRIFQRGTEIVRIITLAESRNSDGLNRPAGTIQLIPMRAIALTETLERLIIWQRLKSKKDAVVPVRVDCPGKIAAAYLSRLGSWRLDVLTGVICAPILRPDGTVLCHAGYDRATGLFLTEDWPELNGKPSRDEALLSLALLLEPYSEFPFVDTEDRSVLAAAILTAIQRRVLPTAPLFGFTAPTQRTGKSLLAECVAIMATGLPAPAMAVSGDREEIRKAVTAALREGHAIMNLDNIEHPLGSPDLSRAITQPIYGDRLLGENSTLRVRTNLTWTATGNNLAFRGDLAVRALLCRLDARLERPEERNFKIAALKQYVAEHRRELVTAAITILRAYVAAGRPDRELKPWGGFDEWSASIRAPLVWLGMADPCASRQHVIEDDPDREAAATLLSEWYRVFRSEAVQVAKVIEESTSDNELRSAVLVVATSKADMNKIDPRRLGWWCRDSANRLVNGLRLVKGKGYGKAARWRVEINRDCGVSRVKNVPQTRPQHSTPNDSEQIYRESFSPTNPTDPKNGSDGPDDNPDSGLFDGDEPVTL